MDDFIARRPILSGKAQVCGYHLVFGQNTGSFLNETRIGYNEFGQITQSLFLETLHELSERTATYLDYSEELTDIIAHATVDKELAEATVIVFGKNSIVNADICNPLKSGGFKLAFDSSFFTDNAVATEFADIMSIDFTMISLAVQTNYIRKYKDKVAFLANGIETWSDFKAARDMGYTLFQGFFFLWPSGGLQQKEVKALDVCLIGIISELDKPEPNFKNISDIIEHDLGLSYKLLRLVNSAYMAPKYRIKSISHALTYLGTRELHQWISMLMFNGVKNDDNAELIRMSLIRGKMMALAAQELQLCLNDSEPFFTGLFSLIDVILNREINDLLVGLPIAEEIKIALRGEGNELQSLLDFVVRYEQAEWQKIDGKFHMNKITPQKMVSFYIEAHKWANLIDN
jgi:EAL and modified HD-GYP domain-containing signal transduction protein